MGRKGRRGEGLYDGEAMQFGLVSDNFAHELHRRGLDRSACRAANVHRQRRSCKAIRPARGTCGIRVHLRQAAHHARGKRLADVFALDVEIRLEGALRAIQCVLFAGR